MKRSSSASQPRQSTAALYVACQRGDEEQVRQLLPRYSARDLNHPEPFRGGNTCLHVATANEHENIVKLLLQAGCYRSSLLNDQDQSAYDIAEVKDNAIRSLYHRPDQPTSRFFEENGEACFDIVRLETRGVSEPMPEKRPSVQTFKTEEEIRHEIEYSASSKTMCQSRLGRFCINHLHSDEPLEHRTITKRLNDLLQQIKLHPEEDDDAKAVELLHLYEQNPDAIEHLLHLYTLETSFYRRLKNDCLPLAIPLFIHLPKLKDRFFKGRVYRGMHLTREQLTSYQLAMDMRGTLLQTRSFSSTSVKRSIAEQFAYEKAARHSDELHVLFVFDFPRPSDQAINLSRTSSSVSCLSEYEDEAEVLILPWALFEVTRIHKGTDDDDLYTVYLTNVIIPEKSLMSTFRWSWVELRTQFVREKKIKFDCGFQKYKTSVT